MDSIWGRSVFDEPVVAKLTKDCAREDCSVAASGCTRTLLGWTPTFDKQGRFTNRDPNTTTTHYRCAVCDRTWKVASQDGQKDAITACERTTQKEESMNETQDETAAPAPEAQAQDGETPASQQPALPEAQEAGREAPAGAGTPADAPQPPTAEPAPAQAGDGA